MGSAEILRTGVALAALAAVAYTLVRVMGLDRPWLQPWSLLRAVVQLGALSLVLQGIIDDLRYVLLFLLVMVLASAGVVARRLSRGWTMGALAALIIGSSAAVPGALVFGSGAIAPEPRYLLAVGGIVIGGVMTISTLFARSLAERLDHGRDQVEGWLAIGATPRQACRPSVREAGSLALMPSTDQTRVTGIVTLPGAFVGAVFGGGSVLEAAAFQLVVLASLLCAGAVAIGLWSLLTGAPRQHPVTAR